MKNKYHEGELWGLGPQRTTEAASCRPAADFVGASLNQVVLPIGGIGTGFIGLTRLFHTPVWLKTM